MKKCIVINDRNPQERLEYVGECSLTVPELKEQIEHVLNWLEWYEEGEDVKVMFSTRDDLNYGGFNARKFSPTYCDNIFSIMEYDEETGEIIREETI